jgi:hypothetical protein
MVVVYVIVALLLVVLAGGALSVRILKQYERAGPLGAENRRFTGKSGVQRRITFFCHAEGRGFESHQPLRKPCKSRPLVEPEAVCVLRRRSRVRSPSANLGKAPANRAVPAASSGRLAPPIRFS